MELSTEYDYVSLLMQRLGRRTNTDVLRPSVVDELKLAQKKLELGRFLPWFLVKEESPVPTITGGTNGILIPSDFIREEEETQPYVQSTDGIKIQLMKGSDDVLRKKYLNAGAGVPKYYSMLGDYFYLWPYPAENYLWNVWYYAKQTVITDSAIVDSALTNPWLVNAPDWLLSTAGIILANFHIQKPDLATRFEKAEAVARDNIITLHEARLHTNMNYSDDSEYQTA